MARDDSHLLGHLLSAAEWLNESTLRDRPSLKSSMEHYTILFANCVGLAHRVSSSMHCIALKRRLMRMQLHGFGKMQQSCVRDGPAL